VSVTVFPYVNDELDEESDVVVAALFTFWLRTAEFTGAKNASPGYEAVMLDVPTGSAAVENVAAPAANVPGPSAAPPRLNVTVPVGVPEPDVSVTLNVTDWSHVDGFTDDVSAMTGAGLLSMTKAESFRGLPSG
jgi:hypothetical protein